MSWKVQSDWIVSECRLEILGCGHRVPVVEFNLLLLYTLFNLLKLFSEADWRQDIVIFIVWCFKHQGRGEKESQVDLLSLVHEVVGLDEGVGFFPDVVVVFIIDIVLFSQLDVECILLSLVTSLKWEVLVRADGASASRAISTRERLSSKVNLTFTEYLCSL